MNYLIKGGEFNNKGAEAMLLVALHNICKNDKDAKIYILDINTYNPYKFAAKPIFFSISNHFLNGKARRIDKTYIEDLSIDLIKLFIPWKRSTIVDDRKANRILRKIDVMIDISGYALGSNWGEKRAYEYMDWIYIMKRYGAKVVLMPQSFGPFDFSTKLLKYIKDGLSICDIIYARENSAFDKLKKMHLNNIFLSNDSVLLEKKYDLKKEILNFNDVYETYNLVNNKNIGIVPNYRLLDKGNIDKKCLLDLYIKIVSEKVDESTDCYLIAHAGEDLELCKIIKSYFINNDKVIFIDHVLNSFSYQALAANLDYVIASRYHSIVHAYKEGTPCVILGWSEKYDEIARVLNQSKYLIEINNEQKIIDTIDEMEMNYKKERKVISLCLATIQENCCYNFLKNS